MSCCDSDNKLVLDVFFSAVCRHHHQVGVIIARPVNPRLIMNSTLISGLNIKDNLRHDGLLFRKNGLWDIFIMRQLFLLTEIAFLFIIKTF